MCFFCKGCELKQSTTTHCVTLSHGLIIVKNVPCEECVQCGEKYFSDEVMQRLDEIVEQVKRSLSEIVITDYAHKAA